MITDLTNDRPMIEKDATPSFDLRDWAKNITDQVNFLTPESGVGSPEGVVSAKVWKEYFDTTGTAGNIDYRKRDDDIAGDDTQGWI